MNYSVKVASFIIQKKAYWRQKQYQVTLAKKQYVNKLKTFNENGTFKLNTITSAYSLYIRMKSSFHQIY